MKVKPTLIAGSIALVLFYAYVLILLLNPAVSEDYRRYYITREAQSWAVDVEGLQALARDEVLSFDSNKLAFDGWSSAEQEFRWSLGHSPRLYFLLEGAATAEQMETLVLRFRPLGQQRVRVLINEEAVLAAEYDDENIADVAIALPTGLLREGSNTIRFELPDARLPGNGDPRELGLALFSLSLKRG